MGPRLVQTYSRLATCYYFLSLSKVSFLGLKLGYLIGKPFFLHSYIAVHTYIYRLFTYHKMLVSIATVPPKNVCQQ